MDGKQFWLVMKISSIVFVLLLFSKPASATDEPLDMAFLEWLGETADAEELGLDINKLIQLHEDSEQKTEENSQ